MGTSQETASVGVRLGRTLTDAAPRRSGPESADETLGEADSVSVVVVPEASVFPAGDVPDDLAGTVLALLRDAPGHLRVAGLQDRLARRTAPDGVLADLRALAGRHGLVLDDAAEKAVLRSPRRTGP